MDFIIVPDTPGCLCYPQTEKAAVFAKNVFILEPDGAIGFFTSPKSNAEYLESEGFTAEIRSDYEPS